MSAPMTLRDDSVTAGAPVALFPAHIVLGGSDNPTRGQYAVAPDGRFLINRIVDDQPASPQPPQQQPLTRIAIVQNWSRRVEAPRADEVIAGVHHALTTSAEISNESRSV